MHKYTFVQAIETPKSPASQQGFGQKSVKNVQLRMKKYENKNLVFNI